MIYDRLTDEALADRLRKVAGDVRAFTPIERSELLEEAAKRLVVDRQVELDKFKARVRDFAVAQADRRGWCGEFDSIISQLGIAGRWSNYRVTISFDKFTGEYKHVGTPRQEPAYEKAEESKTCIARDEAHAFTLVQSYFHRNGYQNVQLVRTEHVNSILGASAPAVEGRSQPYDG